MSEDIKDITSLLKIISNINDEYEESLKKSGEKFNIFEILRLKELSHSKILAALLDPRGSHSKGDLFLKLFFEKFLPKGVTNDFSKCNVYKEYYIGDLGQIDIYIDCQNFGVVIENKINDAGDQSEQLIRYDKFLKKRYTETSYLFYLTKYGEKASEQASKDVEYKTLSYKDDIQKWLERCKEESVDNSILNGTLTQYILSIRQITGQPRSEEMCKKIVDTAIQNPDNVKAAFAIAANVDAIKRKIVLEHFVPAMEKLAQKHNLELEVSNYDCVWGQYWKLSLSNDLLRKNCISICFEFQDKNLGRLFYGFRIWVEDSKMKEVYKEKNSLRDFIKVIGKTGEPYWIFCDMLYEHWHREQLADLVIPEKSEIIKNCEQKIKYLIDLLEKAEKG